MENGPQLHVTCPSIIPKKTSLFALSPRTKTPPPAAEPSKVNSGVDDENTNVAYYVAPVVAVVLIAVIVIWRRSLDTSDNEASMQSVVSHNFDKERLQLVNNTGNRAVYSNSMASVDSGGYLQPGTGSIQTSLLLDDENEPKYYVAGNLNDNANSNADSDSDSDDLNSRARSTAVIFENENYRDKEEGGPYETVVTDIHYDTATDVHDADTDTDDESDNKDTPQYSSPKKEDSTTDSGVKEQNV